MNASLDNQSLKRDSLFAEIPEQVCNCEHHQSDTYLQLKQDPTQGLGFKSELPASTLNLFSQHDQQYQDDRINVSTQHQEYQADISMASSKKYNGL